MARLESSERPYPDANTTTQREANRAAAALRSCAERRSLATPLHAAAWLALLRGARRRDGQTPCLQLLPRGGGKFASSDGGLLTGDAGWLEAA